MFQLFTLTLKLIIHTYIITLLHILTCDIGFQENKILQGPISQRDLSPDLDLNLRLWS